MNLVCWRQQNWAGLFTAYPRSSFLRLSLSLCESCCDHSCSCRIYRIWFDVFSSNASQENKNELNLSSFLKQVAALFFISILFAFILTSHSITASLRVKKRERKKKRHKSKNKSYTSFACPIVSAFNNAQCYSKSKILCMPWLEIFRSVWYLWPFTTRQQKSLNK